MAKSLADLVDAKTAAKIEREIRQQTESLFEMSGKSGAEDTRDNLWEMYIEGTMIADYGGKIVGASHKLYNDIFEQIAQKHGVGKVSQERKRFVRQLAAKLQDRIKGYKKIDPDTYHPTAADLAKLDEIDIAVACTFTDLTKQLTNLVELTLCETGDTPKPGGPKTLAASFVAPTLRRLILTDDVGDALEGAIANPTFKNIDYLALYDTPVKPAQLAAALKRWPKLETLALRGKVGTKMLEVVATAAPRLVELALVNAELKDAALEPLLTTRPWPKLKRLVLWGHELSAPLKKKLEAALPKGVKIKAGE